MALFSIVLVFVAACSADSIVNPIDFPSGSTLEFTLQEEDEVTLMPDKISIVFLAPVEEGKCPKGVACIWQGEAKIKLRVTQPGRTSEEIRLTMPGLVQTPYANKPFVYGKFSIVLRQLDPYPVHGETIQKGSYRARIAIERR